MHARLRDPGFRRNHAREPIRDVHHPVAELPADPKEHGFDLLHLQQATPLQLIFQGLPARLINFLDPLRIEKGGGFRQNELLLVPAGVAIT